MSELKHHLRKQDFPSSAREALLRLEKLCLATSPQQQRLIQEIMEEFVFCEIDRRGIRKKRLSAIQELQLVDVLVTYFETRENEVVRNTMFLTLFHYEGAGANGKMKLFAKLISTVIVTKCVAVLNCSAVWMQQQGCTSDVVIALSQELVRDYILLFPKSIVQLEELPQISLSFTAHFITAVTSTYSCSSGTRSVAPVPPLSLLRCIAYWIMSNPRLCSTPLVTNLQSALPKGSIVMPAVVPLIGLIRWCTEAPLYSALNSKSTASSNESEDKEEQNSLYSQLHLGILETMLAVEEIRDSMIQKDVMSMRDFKGLCENIATLTQNLDCAQHSDSIQLALNRLGQSLQVAWSTGCLRGNIGELRSSLLKLPPNRLIRIVLSQSAI